MRERGLLPIIPQNRKLADSLFVLINYHIRNVPYRIDLFAVFIFLGIIQAVFLSFIFLSKENRKSQFNVFRGLTLIAIACIILEIFLMYSSYIIHAFYLVDFSESMGLVIGPLFYFSVISLRYGKVKQLHYLHLVPFVLYSFYLMLFLALPEDAKYNAWLGSYHPELPFRDYDSPYNPDPICVRKNISEITLVSILFYSLIGLVEVVKAFKKKNESFWKPETLSLRSLRDEALIILTVFFAVLLVKLTNLDDTGDHIFAAYISLTIYFTSFSMIARSPAFKHATLNEPQKYKGSTLTAEQQQNTLERLQHVMNVDKPFLRPDFSLPDLAQKLNVTVHTLSQVINDGLGKSFFEMLAEYRVEEAKQLLKDQPNIKIEEIAEQVGYNSKSSFNTAFKKITGKTPSEYRSA